MANPAKRCSTIRRPARYPRYYLQKFHFQSDGYLSDASAERYDHQVEVLFGGGAAAMRRQALVPLRQALAAPPSGAGRGGRGCSILPAAPARFLREVKTNWPRLVGDRARPVAALSRGRRGARWRHGRGRDWSKAPPRRCPSPTAEFDVVTCIYLFHELPPQVRRAVAAEIRRVLRPGGDFDLRRFAADRRRARLRRNARLVPRGLSRALLRRAICGKTLTSCCAPASRRPDISPPIFPKC